MTARTAPAHATLSPLKRLLDRSPLVGYCLLAYGLTWAILLPAGLARHLGLTSDDAGRFGLLALLAPYGPAITALIVTAVTAGRAGVEQLLRRLVQWRVGVGWYLLVLFGVPLVELVGASVVLGRAPLVELSQGWPMVFTRYLPYALTLVLVVTPLGEEPGWRGFALPRLQARYGPLRGTLVLAVVWSLWHAPNLLFGGWTAASFAAWLLATIASAFLYTWVYNSTGGSLLLAMLLHSAINTSSNLVYRMVPELAEPGLLRLYLGIATGFGLGAALLVVATRGRLGYAPGGPWQPTGTPPLGTPAAARTVDG